MSCFMSVDDPDNRTDLVRPIKMMNDELIAYQNGLPLPSEHIRLTLNLVFWEDESCLFCKSKQDGTKLYFYGSIGSLSNILIDSLNDGVEKELLSHYSLNVFLYRGEIVFKLTLEYYDCILWLIEQTEEAIEIHREYIKDYGEMVMPYGIPVFPARKHYNW